jgi:hypothetical protein
MVRLWHEIRREKLRGQTVVALLNRTDFLPDSLMERMVQAIDLTKFRVFTGA